MAKIIPFRPVLVAIAAASFGLSGCISIGSEPPDTLFGLTPDTRAPAGEIERGLVGSALAVGVPTTEKRLAVTRIPVQIDPSNIAYVEDAQWVDLPSRLFQTLLVETVRARSGRLVLDGNDPAVVADDRLDGNLIDMGYDVATASAVVRFDAVRRTAGGQVVRRRFESAVPVVEPEAEFIGPALNQAANDVAGQVAGWLGG